MFAIANMFLFIFVFVGIIILYFYNTRTFSYWKKRGIKYEEPALFFGTNKEVYLGRQSRTQFVQKVYWKYPNEKVVGGFRSTTPELIIRDPQLIKDVLVTDFSSFYVRGLNAHKTVFEPLRMHLFGLEGDLWRMVRQKLTPAFTSGKLKAMFPIIVKLAEKLQARTLAAAIENRSIDARNTMACFMTDIIGTYGFGIDTDSLKNENSAFRKLGVEMFKVTRRDAAVAMLKEIFPELCKNMKNFARVEKSFFDLINQILIERNHKPAGKNDFIDLLLEYQMRGPMEATSLEMSNPDGTPVEVSKELDDILFAAQVFIFFAAGFETSSSSTSFTLHQLAYNPDVQKKVQDDIDNVLAKHNNVLSYDAIKEMTYLECAFKEAMRMFPSLGYLMRKSTKKYTFKDINLSIDEDVVVLIPVQALHNDPKYWNNPEEYRPERFHPDNFTSLQKSVYFPFGEGPRNCIGKILFLSYYRFLISNIKLQNLV